MMSARKSEQGITAISFIMILVLIGFVAIIAIKLTPVYFENFKLTAALTGLESDPRAQGASVKEVRTLLLAKLTLDDVSKIEKDDVIIEKVKGGLLVSLVDETRVPMMGNVDALVVYSSPVVTLR